MPGKLNTVIENRDAPVEVWCRTPSDQVIERHFKNMDEFEAWYRPKVQHFIGAVSRPEITSLSLDVRDEAAAALSLGAAPRAKPAKADAPSSGAEGERSSRGIQHSVKVGGIVYRSVRAAFAALGLPDKEHQKFRAMLKAKGKAEHRGHKFEIVER